jgi:iron(III) transport system substrate-binding protein
MVPASMRAPLVGLLAAATLVLSGCGGSPTADDNGDGGKGSPKGTTAAEKFYKKYNGMSDDERRDALVKAAQEEGEFNLYTSMTAEVADEVTGAFSDEFDVDVNLYRASSETVLQRVLQEQKAGYHGSDAIESNATEMFALEKEGYLADYSGTRRDEVQDAGTFDGWTATRFNLFAPSWNTKLVKSGEQPTSWEDLADPKWDGQLSMELEDYDWYLTLYKYWQDQGKSDDEINGLFSQMADGAKIVKGHTVQGELMSAGQFSVTASNYSYLVEQQKRTGAPVDYLPFVQPVIARPNGIGLLRTAEHPAAAMLFTDWILSEEGQKVLVDLGLTPSIPIAGAEDPLAGVDVIPVDVAEILNNSDKWSKQYAKVVEGGEVVESE